LSDETLQVPLMVRLPGGIGGGQRVPGPRELIDVAPTAWALAGLHGPAGVRGRYLLGEAGPEADPGADPAREEAFSQGALRLLSVRSADARLVASGLAADNPWTGSLLAAAPVDGVSLALTGPADQAATLQAALVARLAALDTPARAQR
jgi:arylsulfatase A-like enzyme